MNANNADEPGLRKSSKDGSFDLLFAIGRGRSGTDCQLTAISY